MASWFGLEPCPFIFSVQLGQVQVPRCPSLQDSESCLQVVKHSYFQANSKTDWFTFLDRRFLGSPLSATSPLLEEVILVYLRQKAQKAAGGDWQSIAFEFQKKVKEHPSFEVYRSVCFISGSVLKMFPCGIIIHSSVWNDFFIPFLWLWPVIILPAQNSKDPKPQAKQFPREIIRLVECELAIRKPQGHCSNKSRLGKIVLGRCFFRTGKGCRGCMDWKHKWPLSSTSSIGIQLLLLFSVRWFGHDASFSRLSIAHKFLSVPVSRGVFEFWHLRFGVDVLSCSILFGQQ